MNKLEQAAREVIRQHSMECLSDKTVDALREALAVSEQRMEEQAEQEPVLWGDDKFAPHERPQKPKECADGCPPLQVCDYCQTAEQAGQGPVAEVVLRNQTVGFGRTEERKDVMFLADVDVGTKLYAAAQKPKQEPVATDLMDMLRLIETIKYLRGIAERGLGREIRDDETIEQFVLGYVKQLEAAPVRTKDLTDEDLCKIGEAHALGMECEGYENNMLWYEVNPLPAFRAVIAADRENNK